MPMPTNDAGGMPDADLLALAHDMRVFVGQRVRLALSNDVKGVFGVLEGVGAGSVRLLRRDNAEVAFYGLRHIVAIREFTTGYADGWGER